MLTNIDRRSFLKQLRRPGIDNLRRTQICKKINEQCRKAKICPYCDAVNGQIRKIGTLKLTHDKYVTYNKSTAAKKVMPSSMVQFQRSFSEAKKNNPEVDKHMKKAMEDLNPLRVLNLFKMISPTDCELLGINPAEGRPEMFIWQFVPAPPVCIRPSVAQDSASTEDDLTTKLADIVHISSLIRTALHRGQPVQTIMEQWEYLQVQIALYVNSDVPGLQQTGYGKPIRGFCQRLKGKQGRFRGNLSGKRVDFSGRTVISPDPNLGIDQVAVPILVAKNLTYPERVQIHNLKKLRQLVLNGPNIHPGAQQIIKKDSDHKISLKFARREKEANNLRPGDIVERHLEDGDIVLFNRQPSLHKLSIMSHYVKVRPWRTFRLNECVCTPYNADFDGDEMNLHVPQTEEARTEAINLMGVKNNLSTPKNGEPIIAATQDFITAAYLLSEKSNFFDRKTFTNLCMYMLDGATLLDLPPPAILKPQALWTGKQVFNILMRPNKRSPVLVNLDAKCRDYKPPKEHTMKDMDINDGWLVVRNSEIMCGRMDKTTVGSGRKESIFYIILRDFGPDEAVAAMNRLAKLSARYLTNQGFSIGISDVLPSASLTAEKDRLVFHAYKECEKLIQTFKEGKLEKMTGFTPEESLEASISKLLSEVRQGAGDYCIDTLNKWNSPLIMAKSGSKGSVLNVAQMIAVVGQQIISGKRVPDGFQDRSLPHFPKNSRQPPSKGFVRNSFFTGLTPSEFLFHAMSGREGLVDTAVKTAETGYMSRRLMKSLEDLSVQYDDTVRNSSNIVVQFQFGADKLDPLDMEGEAVPVNFERTWNHAESLTLNNHDPSLLPYQIKRYCQRLLAPQKAKYERKGLLYGEDLPYKVEHSDDIIEAKKAAENKEEKKAIAKKEAKKVADERKAAKERVASGISGKVSVTVDVKKAEKKSADSRAKEKKPGSVFDVPKTAEQDANDKKADYAVDEHESARGFLKSIEDHVNDMAERVASTRQKVHLPDLLEDPKVSGLRHDVSQEGNLQRAMVDRVTKISLPTLEKFVELCLTKYAKAQVEPGHAVGAVGAQSIGEPGTQMTLKTFHFAGIGGKNTTGGVPRIKEIINASKVISTPLIICPLENKDTILAARIVKGRIEKTFVSDVIRFIEDMWSTKKATLCISVNTETLDDMHLGLSVFNIAEVITNNKKLKINSKHVTIRDSFIYIDVFNNTGGTIGGRGAGAKSKLTIDEGGADLLLRVNHLKRSVPLIPISGYPDAGEAIIMTDANSKYAVHVEGYGLRACINTEGVIGTKVTTNSIMETRDVLGIEAARTTIAKEIAIVMQEMAIDPRHMQLLADVMTYKGEVLGITRFGLSKMRDSVLQLASFEKTPDHLFEAAAGMKSDKIEGVSESIIMGQTMGVGTGAFQVVRKLHLEAGGVEIAQKPTAFEDAWKWDQVQRRKAARRSQRVV